MTEGALGPHPAVWSVTTWLLTEGRRCPSVPALLRALASQLRPVVPVERVWVGTEVLHPQAAAYLWVWEAGAEPVDREVSYDRFALLQGQDSPARRLQRDARSEVRFVHDGDDGHDLADVTSLWARGYRELVGLSLVGRERWEGAVTWATRHEDGFDEVQRAILRGVMPAVSAVVDGFAQARVRATLLQTYLGEDAGRRVAEGQVHRGEVRTHRGAIWFSDVRGFTQLSQRAAQDELLAVLNEVLGHTVEAVAAHGGQVLKFMGDGVLAVFSEAEAGDGRSVCAAAKAAALQLQERLGARADGADHDEASVLARVGVGLHYGSFAYGNIGAPSRLDFTAIGPDVNLAARVEGQCSGLAERVLATEEVARRVDGAQLVARRPLKGIGGDVPLYRLG